MTAPELSLSSDMVLIHDVFRREFGLLPGLVRAASADEEADRVEPLARHLDLLLATLDHHHEGEDLLLWPLLRERAAEHSAVYDAMDAQHRGIHDALSEVQTRLAAWRESASAADGEALATAVADLATPLLAHLDQEEQQVLRIVDATLTPPEWGQLGQRAMMALEPDDLLIVLAQMHEDAGPEVWTWFTGHLPPPVLGAYDEQGGPAYAAYLAQVRG